MYCCMHHFTVLYYSTYSSLRAFVASKVRLLFANPGHVTVTVTVLTVAKLSTIVSHYMDDTDCSNSHVCIMDYCYYCPTVFGTSLASLKVRYQNYHERSPSYQDCHERTPDTISASDSVFLRGTGKHFDGVS